jgi:hypothetical protein
MRLYLRKTNIGAYNFAVWRTLMVAVAGSATRPMTVTFGFVPGGCEGLFGAEWPERDLDQAWVDVAEVDVREVFEEGVEGQRADVPVVAG